MSSAEHSEAVLALLGGDPALRVYDGEAPDDAELPYAVVYFGPGSAARTRLTPTSTRFDQTFQVTSVGYDRDGAQWVADHARALVLDRRPVVAGRTAWSITQTASQPIRRDDDVEPHLMYGVDIYAWSTTPAATS